MTHRRQSKHRKPRSIRGLFRLLPALLVLAMFIGQHTVALIAPYFASDCCSQSCPDEEDTQNCPCPLQCASCCLGNALRAIPPAAIGLDRPVPAVVELLDFALWQAPLSAEPAEILHVPKPRRA
jgi:hypothetical protein